MLAEAQQAGDAYNQAVQGADNDPFAAALPWEVRDKVNTFHIIPQYQESVDGLLIPQFFQVIPQSLFTDGDIRRLSLHGLTGAKSCANSLTVCHRQSILQTVRRFTEGHSMKPRRT